MKLSFYTKDIMQRKQAMLKTKPLKYFGWELEESTIKKIILKKINSEQCRLNDGVQGFHSFSQNITCKVVLKILL